MMKHYMKLPIALTIATVFCTLSVAVAQSSVSINASGIEFTPSQVTIQQGDTVHWFNVQGNHSINGSLSAYPDNPEPFGIGVGIGWTYSHVFDIAGVYNYHCDPHVSVGMTGVVIVEEITTGTADLSSAATFELYPMPASDRVVLRFQEAAVSQLATPQVVLYDQLGRKKSSVEVTSNREVMDVSRFPSGLYFLQLVDDKRVIHTRKLVIK